MGCGASTLDLTTKHAAILKLMALDDNLEAAYATGAIKLILADVLRSPTFQRIERRQDLERLEKEQGIRIFLTPDEAVAELRACKRGRARSIGSLTYGWQTPDHPDVTNVYLKAVRRFLCSAEGAHVKACFWECAPPTPPPHSPGSPTAPAASRSAIALPLWNAPRSFASLLQWPRDAEGDKLFFAALAV